MTFEVGNCLLRERLKLAGMTQQELADRTGITRQQISDYSTNRRVMSLRTAYILSIALSEVVPTRIEDLYDWIQYK
jgi:transcriptional regulator with XRE-family HTH domain